MTDRASARTTESVAAFAEQARGWLANAMPRIDPLNPPFADRGDKVLVQLLSEPSGGSDLAGVITRTERADTRG